MTQRIVGDTDDGACRGEGTFRFGVFELDVLGGELRRHGIKIKLQQKPFQILALLLEHRGQVVLGEERALCRARPR